MKLSEIDIPISRTILAQLGLFLSGVRIFWAEGSECIRETISETDLSGNGEICQRVFFSNHTSHLDPLVIWSALPRHVRDLTRPVAAKDYWEKGYVRPYIANRCFHALLLERKEIKVHSSPISFMLDQMGSMYSIIIFPEGTRGNGIKVAPFKSGLYHLAKKKPELELIPIYLENMGRILPRGQVLPVPMLSRLVFGPPMWLEKKESRDQFLTRARNAVLKLRDNPTIHRVTDMDESSPDMPLDNWDSARNLQKPFVDVEDDEDEPEEENYEDEF